MDHDCSHSNSHDTCVHSHDHGTHDRHGHTHDGGSGHSHGGHGHSHDLRGSTKSRLWIALLINALFLVVEVIGGFVTGSLALLADAGHMLTDVAALVLALFVTTLAERPPTPRRTYGLLRAEVFGAFINGASLMVVVVLVIREAWHRLHDAGQVNGPAMLVIAVLGLIANAVSARVLFDSHDDNVNIRAAFLHMAADALGSVGAITAGLVIWLYGWTMIDSIVSVVIAVLIFWGSFPLLIRTVNILLEATPENIDYAEVHDALLEIEHVIEVHDLHIWTITSGIPSLSAHVMLEPRCSDSTHWQDCLKNAQKMLRERFGIVHSTLQFEPEDFEKDGRSI